MRMKEVGGKGGIMNSFLHVDEKEGKGMHTSNSIPRLPHRQYQLNIIIREPLFVHKGFIIPKLYPYTVINTICSDVS
jgi:hypothetical protein